MKELTIEQFDAMISLKPGDVFSFHDRNVIREAEFVDFKKVNLLAKMDGILYNIRKTNFVEIISRAKPKEKAKMDMKPGELFYIQQNNRALLFEFVSMTNASIIGKDVLTGGKTRIQKSMFAGTVKQYQKQQKELEKAE